VVRDCLGSLRQGVYPQGIHRCRHHGVGGKGNRLHWPLAGIRSSKYREVLEIAQRHHTICATNAKKSVPRVESNGAGWHPAQWEVLQQFARSDVPQLHLPFFTTNSYPSTMGAEAARKCSPCVAAKALHRAPRAQVPEPHSRIR